jgi:hypothetical protein
MEYWKRKNIESWDKGPKKSTHSTPRPKRQDMLRVDTEQRFLSNSLRFGAVEVSIPPRHSVFQPSIFQVFRISSIS